MKRTKNTADDMWDYGQIIESYNNTTEKRKKPFVVTRRRKKMPYIKHIHKVDDCFVSQLIQLFVCETKTKIGNLRTSSH